MAMRQETPDPEELTIYALIEMLERLESKLDAILTMIEATPAQDRSRTIALAMGLMRRADSSETAPRLGR